MWSGRAACGVGGAACGVGGLHVEWGGLHVEWGGCMEWEWAMYRVTGSLFSVLN